MWEVPAGLDEDRSLGRELARRRAAADARLTREEKAILEAATERLEMLQVVEFAAATGEVFPDFALPDASGALHRSADLLDAGPLVVAFFRGGFCPFCGAAMEAYDRLVEPLRPLGATLLGVLPERPEVLRQTVEEKDLGFTLVGDPEARLARLVGVQFEMPSAHVAFYRGRGLDIAGRNDGSGWALPVPAIFVLRQDGVIAQAFADTDHRRRAEPVAILDSVRRLVG